MEVKAKWPLAPCESPSGLSMDKKNRRCSWGATNKMTAVVDADSGKVLATPAIGDGVDATAFDDGNWAGFRIVRGRCAERNSRRFAGEIQRRGKRSHASRRAHHGARFQKPTMCCGDGEVRGRLQRRRRIIPTPAQHRA